MHSFTHKWLLILLFILSLTIPVTASAQEQVSFNFLTVQLWPEFDQPSMLVIYDFSLAEGTLLPVDVVLRIPTDATLIAVAYAPPGSNLLNAPSEEPYIDGDWQVITLNVDTEATYHIEYYAPLSLAGSERTYVYLWPGDYEVESFNLSVKVPMDTTEISTDPPSTEFTPEDNSQTYLRWEASDLVADEKVPITLTYTKTSNRLSMSEQPLETGLVDENTPGRVSLSNYIPYFLGGLVVIVVFVIGFYFWQNRKSETQTRKRHRSRSHGESGEDVYCYQCGKRAQPDDRFCRTCGTRLRKED